MRNDYGIRSDVRFAKGGKAKKKKGMHKMPKGKMMKNSNMVKK
jgi:hypothetical protein